MERRPLLVTGLPRSGTSWIGKMLEASRQVVYVNEPMSLSRPPGGSPGVLDARVTERFQYIDASDDVAWRSAFADTLRLRFHPLRELTSVRRPYHVARGAKYAVDFTIGSLRGRRAMIDDPNAIFASRWLADTMEVQTLFVVRDPVGMIGSWRQLGWQPQLQAILSQPKLVADCFAETADEIEASLRCDDWLGQMCCLWNAGNRFVRAAVDELENTTVRRYEDLAFEPLEQYRSLYEWFDLDWSDDARAAIQNATTASGDHERAFSWSLRGGPSRTAFRRMDSRASVERASTRLDEHEADRVRAATADVLALFPRTTP